MDTAGCLWRKEQFSASKIQKERNVPRAACNELWKCPQQDTTRKPVGEGTLFGTSGEGCKYENKSLFQNNEAQSPLWAPSSSIWTWMSTMGSRLRSPWAPAQTPRSSQSSQAGRPASLRVPAPRRGPDQHHPQGEGPASSCHHSQGR